jgi:hypothetical protein
MIASKKRVIFSNKYERKFLIVFCGLVVGSFWVSFIIWNRLFRERFPADLAVVELYSSTFWFVLILFCYFFIVVIIYLYQCQKEWRGITKTNKYVLRFAEWADNQPIINNIYYFISYYILNADKFLWRYFYLNFPFKELKYKYCINYIFTLSLIIHDNIFHVVVPLNVWVTQEDFLKKHILTTKLLLYYPRIIAFSVFLSEIAIYKRLYYFYFVAVILLIPLIFLALRRMFQDIASYEEVFLLEEDLIVVESDDNRLRYRFEKKDPSMSDTDFVKNQWKYLDLKRVLIMSNLFFEADSYLGKIYNYKFVTTLLIMLGFLFWLLIIFKLH